MDERIEQPAAPAHSTAPVQPRTDAVARSAQPGDVSIPSKWLDDHDSAAAAALDRLVADADMITGLALNGYTGPDYDHFANALAKYAVSVLSSWMRRGLIFERCKGRGYGGLPPVPEGAFRDPDTVAELAGETVTIALRHFRANVLLKRVWDPSKGATIKTFFIGQCLLRFSNVYRSWWLHERQQAVLVDPETLRALVGVSPGPETAAVAWVDSMTGLRAATSSEVKAMLILAAADIPQAEIARRVGKTEKAVERALAYHHERMRRRWSA